MALNGNICLVTGAAQGLGRAIAVELAARGAGAVVIADRNLAGARETAAAIEGCGTQATALEVCSRTRVDQAGPAGHEGQAGQGGQAGQAAQDARLRVNPRQADAGGFLCGFFAPA